MRAIQTAPPLAEQVYQAVLEEICDGVLTPGAHLVQEQLAERFGVSRQPVQQAMALLKADRLVEEVGRRGLQVAALDVAVMRHHYEIRGALDGLAARTAALRARTDAALAQDIAQRGRVVLAEGARLAKQAGVHARIRQDEAFHRLVYEASGNPLLAATAEPHWRFLRRAMGEVVRHAEPATDIWRQHGEILDAIVAGDPPRAESLAVHHIRLAADRLTEELGLGRGLRAAAAPRGTGGETRP